VLAVVWCGVVWCGVCVVCVCDVVWCGMTVARALACGGVWGVLVWCGGGGGVVSVWSVCVCVMWCGVV